MVAILNFIALTLLITGSQVATQACNEIQFVELGNSDTCPGEGNYAMPGDCQAYLQCLCQVGVMETLIASCSKGELFVDGKCQKESDVQSCPQANCTEKEVYSGTLKTFNYSCPATETTTEANEEVSSTTEVSAAGSAEKSTLESKSSATGFFDFSSVTALIASGIIMRTLS